MTWNGDLLEQVLHEFLESARLNGAKTPSGQDTRVGEREAETLTKLVDAWLAKEADQFRSLAYSQLESGATHHAEATVAMAKAVAACAHRFKTGKWRELLAQIATKA